MTAYEDTTDLLFYDDPAFSGTLFGCPSVFLAGPSSEARWRPDAVRLLRTNGFTGLIIIPEFRSGVFDKSRFDDSQPSTIPGMSRSSQRIMQWETTCIENAAIMLAWMPYTGFDDPRHWTGLSTRGEVARAIESEQRRPGLVLGMPPDAFRSGQDRYHAHRRGVPIYPTLDEACARVAELSLDWPYSVHG